MAASALFMSACGGERDGGSLDLSKGLAAVFGGVRMKALAAGTAAQGGVLINEVHAANWKGDLDEDGEAEDWIELYNPADTAVDLSGYGLTNNTRSPFRWTFPDGQRIGPQAYLRVWLSKKNRSTLGQPLHASFNLDNGSDTVYLSASNATAAGILVDSTKPAFVKPDFSWCRLPSGQASAPFQICAQPTAGAANSGPSFAVILAKPVLSLPSGLYAQAQTVEISGPAGATIRYTTDGSVPTESSPAYTGPITVSSSQALRAAAFSAGALSSPTETNSYVIDASLAQRYSGLRVAFAVMPPADLVRFQARDDGLETLVHLELINAGARLLKQDAAGSVSGNLGSVNSPQVSLNLNAKDAFGPKDFVSTGVLWPSKPAITTTKKLRLRNGGNDWDRARLRDVLAQDLASAGPNIIGASAPAVMFMNGRYYGHMNLREREDETSVTTNLGADKDYVDFLENPPGPQIKNGGLPALNAYRRSNDFIRNNDMAFQANFERAKSEVDLTSLAWDWGHHLLMANYDWPHNNVYVFRSPELGSRWTWRPHDFDFSFGRYAGPERNMNDRYSAVNSGMFMSLVRNPEFRHLFLNAAADQMNLMTPTFMNARLDAMVTELRPYMNDVFVANNLGGEAVWNTRVAEIRQWMKLREPFHDQHLRDQFTLGNRGAIAVTISDRNMGSVKVNTLDVGAQMGTGNAWSGKYYPGVPITLEAQPKPGFVFVGWRGASTTSSRTINHTIQVTPSLPSDGFSVRWTGQLMAPATGSYRFQLIADDSVELVVNGQTLVSDTIPRAETMTTTNAVQLTAGQRYDVAVRYADFSGGATVRLLWLPPGASEFVTVPATQLYPEAAATKATGLLGVYFANTSLTGNPVAEAVEHLDFAWGSGAPTPSRAQFEAVFAQGPVPAAPSVAPVPPQSALTGDLVNLKIIATDPQGHALRYTATGLPRGVGINAATGIIFGRLTTPGTYSANVTVTNGPSSAALPITWTVTDRPGTGLLGTSADSGQGAPNSNPPAVSLTSPATAQTMTLGATLSLVALATDTRGSVARVEFFDGALLVGRVNAAPYTLNWTPATVGDRLVTAVAVDNQGASTTSAPVSVNVVPAAVNLPPTVTLEQPLNAQVVANGASLALVAQARDLDGSIARVEFFEGTTLLGSAESQPYRLTINPRQAGVRQITVRAVDNLGASTISPSVNILVAAAGTVALPSSAVNCATENNACTVPGGQTATIFFGGAGHFFSRTGQSGTVSCSAALFGEPISGVARFCGYVLNGGTSPGTPGVLTAQYWSNRELSGTPRVTEQGLPSLNLAAVDAPRPGMPISNFSIRWSGSLTPEQTGLHRFSVRTSTGDGMRLWVNGALLVDTWRSPRTVVEARINLTAGRPMPIRVEFYDAAGDARLNLTWRQPTAGTFSTIPAVRFSSTESVGTANGLRGEYFDSAIPGSSPPLVRIEAVNFDWRLDSPATALPVDNFSARWTGLLVAPSTGTYQFQTVSDDGVRLWLNDQPLINNWVARTRTRDTSVALTLQAGQRIPLRLEFFEQTGMAEMRLRWRLPGSSSFVAIPMTALLPN